MTQEALKQKIKMTKDLYNIVGTMKMLSSVSVGQYEKALNSLTQYTQTVQMAFQGLFNQEGFYAPSPVKEKKSHKNLVICIGSDNGLVGKFNRDVFQFLNEENNSLSNLKFISVGKRMTLTLNSMDIHPLAVYNHSNSLKEISALADALLNKINLFLSKDSYDSVFVIYNERQKSKIIQQKIQLLPFAPELLKTFKNKKWDGKMIPLVNPENTGLFSALSQEYLTIFLINALTCSLACEHYVRMIHMQQAEKNIEKKLNELDLLYQQARQNQITDELIDIISGAEAMTPRLTKV